MQIGFAQALAALGLMLIAGATVSGLVHRTVLSLTVLATAAGAVLAVGGVLDVEPSAHVVVLIVELVLLLTLFGDGLLVEQGLLRRHWHPAARALVVAMPLNAALLACAAKLLFAELGWIEAFLLGFLLSPTDPVITSSIVASTRVPKTVRHTLNLESGLNDGLALPFVLLFLALALPGGGAALEVGGALALESAIGLAVGVAWGAATGALASRLPARAIQERYEGLVLLGTAIAAFGTAQLAHGNGLIAAFVAGVVTAVLRHAAPDVFHERNENITNVLHIVAFAIFGAIVVEVGYGGALAPLVAFVAFALLVARPASVLTAFVGVRLPTAEKLFVAWFGPKGIASMLFALLVLEGLGADSTLLFEVAAFTILASIVAHGLSDTVGAAWIERHVARRDDDEEDEGDASKPFG